MSYVSTVLADAPVHYWRLAEPGGQIGHDIGSTRQHMATAAVVDCFGYTGIAADGGSAAIVGVGSLFAPSAAAVPSPYSAEIWVYRLWLSGQVEVIFGTNPAVDMSLQINAGGTITFQTAAGPVTSPAAITSQAWHHVVGTYGPVGGRKLYIDAVNVATAAVGGALAGAVGLGVGANPITGANVSHAVFAEAAVYNVELTPARITAHFLAQESNATPVWARPSSASGVNGGLIPDSTELAAILAAVRRTF